MNRFIIPFLILVLFAGCDNASLQRTNSPEEQRVAINKVLVANHPHFTQGRSRSPSLNVDAFDFMIGRPKSDFPSIFAVANDPISVSDAQQFYPDFLMDEWINSRATVSSGEATYYIFETAIGRTFGFDGQMDFLLLEIDDNIITAWRLFAITAY